MTKEEWYRCLQHIPWGMLAVGLFLYHPLLGATACLMELAYEVMNDWRKVDSSYKDVVGIVWGILLGGYVLFVLRLSGISP